MAIEIVSVSIKHGDFPMSFLYVVQPWYATLTGAAGIPYAARLPWENGDVLEWRIHSKWHPKR